MNTMRASIVTGGDIEIQCEAAWYGPGSESWDRGLTLLKRKRRLSVHVQRIAGSGLLISRIPSGPDIAVDEAAWNAFAAGKEQLVASIGGLYLTFTRADLAPFLPLRVSVVPFRHSA